MSMFKNAICATLTTGGIAMLCDLPNAWSASLAAGAFVATYAIPPFIQEMKNLAGHAKTAFNKGRQRSGEIAKATLRRGSDLAWACSPTNPDSNVLLGGSVGLAASNVALKFGEVDSNKNIIVTAATVAGGFAGHYLTQFFRAAKPSESSGEPGKKETEKRKHRSSKGDDVPASASPAPSATSNATPDVAAVSTDEAKKKRSVLRGIFQ